MIKILYSFVLIGMLIFSINFTKFITNKFKINRWILAFCAPLVLIIPSVVFYNLSNVAWFILIFIFFVMCIMFFELNRVKIEKRQMVMKNNFRTKKR